MQIVETEERMKLPGAAQAARIPLIQTDRLRALLLDLAAGQSVAPCEMPTTVLYYVIKGQGHLRVGDEQTSVRDGSLAVVPAGAVRSISAAEPMRVLAVQVL